MTSKPNPNQTLKLHQKKLKTAPLSDGKQTVTTDKTTRASTPVQQPKLIPVRNPKQWSTKEVDRSTSSKVYGALDTNLITLKDKVASLVGRLTQISLVKNTPSEDVQEIKLRISLLQETILFVTKLQEPPTKDHNVLGQAAKAAPVVVKAGIIVPHRLPSFKPSPNRDLSIALSDYLFNLESFLLATEQPYSKWANLLLIGVSEHDDSVQAVREILASATGDETGDTTWLKARNALLALQRDVSGVNIQHDLSKCTQGSDTPNAYSLRFQRLCSARDLSIGKLETSIFVAGLSTAHRLRERVSSHLQTHAHENPGDTRYSSISNIADLARAMSCQIDLTPSRSTSSAKDTTISASVSSTSRPSPSKFCELHKVNSSHNTSECKMRLNAATTPGTDRSSRNPLPFCSHCGTTTHNTERCFKLHPHLKTDRGESSAPSDYIITSPDPRLFSSLFVNQTSTEPQRPTVPEAQNAPMPLLAACQVSLNSDTQSVSNNYPNILIPLSINTSIQSIAFLDCGANVSFVTLSFCLRNNIKVKYLDTKVAIGNGEFSISSPGSTEPILIQAGNAITLAECQVLNVLKEADIYLGRPELFKLKLMSMHLPLYPPGEQDAETQHHSNSQLLNLHDADGDEKQSLVPEIRPMMPC